MNRDAKRISPHLTADIIRVKGYIRDSADRNQGFDGDGYVFKQAIRQLRQEGMQINYNRKECSYFAEHSA